jgi:hypothetical protein
MIIHAVSIRIPNFIKAVHIELPDKGIIIRMLEILGQNLTSEPIEIQDNETTIIFSPLDNCLVLLILNKRAYTYKIMCSLHMKIGVLSLRYFVGLMQLSPIINSLIK